MSESNLFTGQPVMNQLLSLIPKSLVKELAEKHGADRYCKNFFSQDHLVTMLYSTFSQCGSLRELISGMQVNQHRLLHLGLLSTPCRSTLADANARRPEAFFEELLHRLYQLHMGGSPDSRLGNKDIWSRLFIMDSTTISLFTDTMQGVGRHPHNGRRKGGAKAHVLIRAQEDVACFVRIANGKENDKVMFRHALLPKGSIVALDKGYSSYVQYALWTEQEVLFVTRMNENAVYEVVEERDVSENQRKLGVQADRVVEMTGAGNSETPRMKARLVHFYDATKKRLFTFMTNNMVHAPATIAAIYKRRWQIELLFKRIKHNYPLHYFLGDSPNAIKIQIWCALIADLLLKVVKDRVDRSCERRWSFANLAGIVRLHLTTYVDLFAFLRNPEKALLKYRPPDRPVHQLNFAFA